jgi:hypothetical protein
VANYYKVLAQSNPSASTLTTAYTVPPSTSTVISTVIITNFGSSSSSYRIAVRPAGASITQAMYIAYDITVPPLDSTALTLGITLATTDVFSVYSSTGLVNFNIFGSEIL